MWPMLLDYSDDECRRILRKLELEAYASVISAFRAQGELTKEKKKMLQELSTVLSISVERHRAEIRRAVNDEHLNTIADRLCGPNTTTDWAIEGRRVVPLMPRLVPQNAFTAIANYAADAQAEKNATMPIPSATGLKDAYNEENEKNIEPVRKRSSTPELNAVPDKFLALDHSPVNSVPCAEAVNEVINNSLLTHSNSPVPQCVLQSVLGKDVGLFPKSSTTTTVPVPSVSLPITQSSKTVITSATSTTSYSTPTIPPQKSLNTPVTKTVTVPTTPTCVQPVRSCFTSVSFNALPNPVENVPVSSSVSQPDATSPPNSMPTPLFSTASGAIQTLPTSATNTFIARARSKVVLASKPVMRPRLSPGTVFSTASQSVNYQNSSSQFPSPNLLQPLHKTVSPLKPRSTCTRVSSPVTSSSVAHCQITTTVHTVPRSQSPVTSGPRATPPITSTHRTPSPITLKQGQNTISLTAAAKSTASSKAVSKPSTVRPPLGPRTVITSVTKSPVPKSATSVVVTASASRQPLPLTVKTSVPPQLSSSAKTNASVTYSSKMLPSPCQTKPVSQPITKTIHYRNEGGLKIISQNLSSNRILPKPSGSVTSQASTPAAARVITTTSGNAITGSARIVNFSQPISARFARALPPSSIAAVNLVNSLPVSGLRVALPVGVTNSSVMRSALPAKPNVIVVHKAQVWPQAPGATIVMTSTGSLSRLSNEAIEEAVTMMQRQEAGRHSGSSTTFKTVTLHHGTSFASSHNMNLQAKSSQVGARKTADVPHTDTVSARSVDKNKPTRIFPTEANSSVTEQSDNSVSLSKKEVTDSVVGMKLPVTTTTSTIIVNKFIEGCANKKTIKIPSTAVNMGKISDDVTGVKLLNLNMNQQVVKEEISVKAGLLKDDADSTVLPIKTVAEVDMKESGKRILEKKLNNENIKETASPSQVSIQDLNLDQLQEGQILELQAQDAAELLSQHGPLSTEVIQLLQQAGLQVEQVEVPDEESPNVKSDAQEISKEYLSVPTAISTTCAKTKEPVELNSQPVTSNISDDLKFDNTGRTIVSTSDLNLLDMDDACDNQSQGTHDGKSQLADPFLKSDVESHCNEDIFLPPVDSSDAETSNEVPQINKDELVSLQARESLGDSPTSQSSLGALVVNNVTVEMEELDSGTLHLSLSPENTVS